MVSQLGSTPTKETTTQATTSQESCPPSEKSSWHNPQKETPQKETSAEMFPEKKTSNQTSQALQPHGEQNTRKKYIHYHKENANRKVITPKA
jgi:hypothetical protein